MSKKIFNVINITSVILSFGTALAGPNMDPGKWEITTKSEMTGMPPQTRTHVQCLTDNDMVPMSDDANRQCRIEDIRVNGSTVSWKITCAEGRAEGMTGTGEITYSGDTMDGFMNMIIPPYGTEVKNILSGMRIGDCDSSSPAAASQSAGYPSGTSNSAVSDAISEDTKEVGQAARDEAREATKERVREGVGGFFRGIFK